ncbi:MAG: N-formylglutamate amidohydrolase, partial [Alphaproteobacteria bacterium]|nr:N-formylglutamate amidohydrolase [Alphaproteobacteria bacterium]
MDSDPGSLNSAQRQDTDVPAFDAHPASRENCPLVFLCDHATNFIPESYGDLGLGSSELGRHIAYDIGAAGVTKALSAHFGATAVLTRFSRLVIDPNRGEDDPTLVMRIADGVVVEGNRSVDATERQHRLQTYYQPYHDAVRHVLDGYLARALTPILISIHSYTEAWKGVARPWHIGILWDEDDRVAKPLLQALRRDGELIVGDNEPYTGELKGDTMWRHGTMRGLPHALIEIRQDLICDPDGQLIWAKRLAQALEETLARIGTIDVPVGLMAVNQT